MRFTKSKRSALEGEPTQDIYQISRKSHPRFSGECDGLPQRVNLIRAKRPKSTDNS